MDDVSASWSAAIADLQYDSNPSTPTPVAVASESWAAAVDNLGVDDVADEPRSQPDGSWALAVNALDDGADTPPCDDVALAVDPALAVVAAARAEDDPGTAVETVQTAVVPHFPSTMSVDLLACVSQRFSDDALDTETLSLATTFWDPQLPLTSHAASQVVAGCSHQRLEQARTVAADVALRYERKVWQSVEEAIANDTSLTLELALEFEAYDGVDFKLRGETSTCTVEDMRHRIQQLQSFLSDGKGEIQGLDKVFGHDEGTVLSKLLQRDGACALIVRGRHGDLHVVWASFTFPLQSGTALLASS